MTDPLPRPNIDKSARPHARALSARLHIDLAAIMDNFSLMSGRIGSGCQAAAVVKADCYGLGMAGILPALEKAGCNFYFVATPEEGFTLRRLSEKPAAVLNGALHDSTDDVIHSRLWPVVNSLADISHWRAAARRYKQALPVVIHFDTGMNRLGLATHETKKLLDDKSLLEGLDVKIIMSHFSCADEKDHPLTLQQHAVFKKIAAHFPQARKSLAASSGLFRSPEYHFDLVRPGMALYGLNPVTEQQNPVKPVVTLEAPVLQVKTVNEGETVGYGATWRFEKETTLATVAMGYADGFMRSLSERGVLYYNGRPCPVRGRVSMDLVTVETDQKIEPGAMMEIIGPHQPVDDLAAAAGTIGYEILTNLGHRPHRIYDGL